MVKTSLGPVKTKAKIKAKIKRRIKMAKTRAKAPKPLKAPRKKRIPLPPLTKLNEQVAKRLQLLRRAEEADEYGNATCVTCGEVKHYKDMQGGHFVERGKSGTKLEPMNIHPQCPGCNLRMSKGVVSLAYTYYEYMVGRYGQDAVTALLERSKQPVRHDRVALVRMLVRINQEIARITRRLGRWQAPIETIPAIPSAMIIVSEDRD